MKHVYVENIRERDLVESPFLVRTKTTAMAKNGKPYLTLKLMDKTGEVEGRVWDRVDEFSSRFDKDDFIQVRAKASVYMGKMQLIVQDLRRVEESEINIGDFLPVSENPVDEMVEQMRNRVAAMENIHLRALMEAFLADERFMAMFSRAPAAKTMHHVYLGGLLEHSLAVASLAEDISGRYEDVDRDLLVTGALLHDVGKVTELRYERGFDYTDAGKLLGHIVIGVEMVEEKIRSLPDFPPQLATLLKHLLLSHHGQYDYGSPKRPKTLEAVILNFLDDLDSKINGVRSHIAKEEANNEPWTSYHRLYDRYFFKGAKAEGESAKSAPREEAPAADKKPGRPQGEKADKKPDRRGRFGFTLAEQLDGKSLDLFSGEDDN
ncbi:MAG: HD domain-containing protein [Desulfuromonadales bacterium]|nr:HD domain-containing protein [Desulfuromonadales bacterium]NIR33471.1 HD domain-containing protein [Desulfuromonadales bacterium]NIS43509.1 HD domain-containing protein [Desulfuromonadales bacterium]